VKSEYYEELTSAFYELLDEDSKSRHYPLITCKICCLEAPAASPNARVCEMCFEDDFWDLVK